MKIGDNMKKGLKLILCSFMAVLLLTGCGDKKNDDQKKDEQNKRVTIKNTIVEGLDIVDFAVLFENNISEVYFTIENNGDETKTFEKIKCTMYDKDKKPLATFDYNVGTIEPNEKLDVVNKLDIDLTKVAQVEYSLE